MTLDTISTMINRSGLSEYRNQIFMHMKYLLGYEWLSWHKTEIIQSLLSVKVVGHNVKRRMGKSVAIQAELARSLSYFPVAGIKALYTVHTASAAYECFCCVAKAVETLTKYFNQTQKQKCEERIRARGGAVDPQDFYYRSEYNTFYSNCNLHVKFINSAKMVIRMKAMPFLKTHYCVKDTQKLM